MIIDHEKKYVFIAVPKTASISVQFSLGWGHDVPEPHLYHKSLRDIMAENECQDYFKFAIIRNPWDRIYSLYNDFRYKRVYQYSAKIRCEEPLLSEFTNFNDMCVRLADSKWKDDLFFRSQFDQLSIDGQIALDFVGRFENLVEDFKIICDRIGLERSLLHMNEGKKEKTYKDKYSASAMEAVRTLYSKDVEEFGYEY